MYAWLRPGQGTKLNSQEVGMFKTKGAMLGVAAVLAGTALLLAGMAINSTAGAATDGSGAPSGLPAIEDIGTDPGTGNPPAAPIEPTSPTAPGAPTTDPLGGAGAGGTAPTGLPSAGYATENNGSNSTLLLALAAMALVGAGVATVGAVRRK
jgi:hypothetical protein